MSVGDLRNNLDRLRSEMKQIGCPSELSDALIKDPNTATLLPILHHALLSYSRSVAQMLVEEGHELFAKNDMRFVEGVMKIMRDVFHYQPQLRLEQFFGEGFLERKIMFVYDVVRCVREKHSELQRLSSKTKVVVSRHNIQRLSEPQQRARSVEPKEDRGSSQRPSSAPRGATTASSSSSTSSSRPAVLVSGGGRRDDGYGGEVANSARVVRWSGDVENAEARSVGLRGSSGGKSKSSSSSVEVSSSARMKSSSGGKVRVRSGRSRERGAESNEYDEEDERGQQEERRFLDFERKSVAGPMRVMGDEVDSRPRSSAETTAASARGVSFNNYVNGSSSSSNNVNHHHSNNNNYYADENPLHHVPSSFTSSSQREGDNHAKVRMDDVSNRLEQICDLLSNKLETVINRVERLEKTKTTAATKAEDEANMHAKIILLETRVKALEQQVAAQQEEIASFKTSSPHTTPAASVARPVSSSSSIPSTSSSLRPSGSLIAGGIGLTTASNSHLLQQNTQQNQQNLINSSNLAGYSSPMTDSHRAVRSAAAAVAANVAAGGPVVSSSSSSDFKSNLNNHNNIASNILHSVSSSSSSFSANQHETRAAAANERVGSISSVASSRLAPHPATAEISDLSAYISSLQAQFRETHDLLNLSKSKGIAAS